MRSTNKNMEISIHYVMHQDFIYYLILAIFKILIEVNIQYLCHNILGYYSKVVNIGLNILDIIRLNPRIIDYVMKETIKW